MLRMTTAFALVLSLGACSWFGGPSRDRATFDGVYFRGHTSAEADSRQRFVASVDGVSESMEGAIEAARHQGIQHCIRYYGTSDIAWEVGPDTPRDALMIEDDQITFMGTCIQ